MKLLKNLVRLEEVFKKFHQERSNTCTLFLMKLFNTTWLEGTNTYTLFLMKLDPMIAMENVRPKEAAPFDYQMPVVQ